MFDVGGRSFGTMTHSEIGQCTTYEVSPEMAEAVRLEWSAQSKDNDVALGALPQLHALFADHCITVIQEVWCMRILSDSCFFVRSCR